VRLDDGRVVDYDEGRVAHTILKAAQAAGEPDPGMAGELAEVVTYFLTKNHGIDGRETVVEPGQIAEMIEQVLLQASPQIARSFMVTRRRGGEPEPHDAARDRHSYGQKRLFADDSLMVQGESEAEAHVWDRARIVDSLTREAALAPEAAERVAERIEERLFASGLKRVTTGLIREHIAVELFELGMPEARQRQAVVGVPRYDLEAALLQGRAPEGGHRFRSPADLDAYLHRSVLSRYVLQEAHREEVAAAHVDGRIHLHGLGDPLRFRSLRISPEGVKFGRPGGRTAAGPDRGGDADDAATGGAGLFATLPEEAGDGDRNGGGSRASAPTTDEQFLALLRAYVEELVDLAAETVTLTEVSVVIAPIVARRSDAGRREFVRRLLGALSGRPARRLRLEVPLDLPRDAHDRPAVGLGGAAIDGLRPADLRPVVRAVAADIVLLLGESRRQAVLAPDVAVIVRPDDFADPDACAIIDAAAGCAAQSGTPRFVVERDADSVPRLGGAGRFGRAGGGSDDGSGNLFARLSDRRTARRAARPTAEVATVAVSLNLAQAAYRAGRGNPDGFTAECDRLLALAQQAVVERAELLFGALSRLSSPLLALGTGTTAAGSEAAPHPTAFDLSAAHARIDIVGLWEAVHFLDAPVPAPAQARGDAGPASAAPARRPQTDLFGTAVSSPDAITGGPRGAIRLLSYLSFALRELNHGSPIELRAAAGASDAVARRFQRIDARLFPEHVQRVLSLHDAGDATPQRYTLGVEWPGAAEPAAEIARAARLHTMLDGGAEIAVPARVPGHDPADVVDWLRHLARHTAGRALALPVGATSCPRCGETRPTPVVVPACCPACGYDAPEFGILLGKQFAATPIRDVHPTAHVPIAADGGSAGGAGEAEPA
jgi:predicted Zn-ribbon and HTH transcriptional regulator